MTTFNFEASYYPGCTMKTTADESARPQKIVLEKLGIKLYELNDWNCCGSSSGHAMVENISETLGARNFSKAPKGRPIVIPCPNCFRNTATAKHNLNEKPELKKELEKEFGPINTDDPVLNIYDVYHHIFNLKRLNVLELENTKPLKDLKVAVYYGCGAMYPKFLRPAGPPRDTIERIVNEIGATVITWPWPHKCCSAFVSAIYPEIAEELVGSIVSGAYQNDADCIVTTCAMCQMNVEMRSPKDNQLPILHLNQLLALYLGEKGKDHPDWWKLHLINPVPMLKKFNLWD